VIQAVDRKEERRRRRARRTTKETEMRRKTFDSLMATGGLVLAVLLLAAGGMLTWANTFVHDQVTTQLSAQHIVFPAQGSESLADPAVKPYLTKYAGQELDDVCAVGTTAIYQKSLLFLVSRALERPGPGDAGEVPLLGMERFFDRPNLGGAGETLRQALTRLGGAAIFARSAAPDDSRSDATSHGWFDDDAATMTSVVLRILGEAAVEDVSGYQPNAALDDVSGESDFAAAFAARQPRPAKGALPVEVAAHAPGSVPVVETAEPQRQRPRAPRERGHVTPDVAVAPGSGSPVLDILRGAGWDIVNDLSKPTSTTPRRSRSRPRTPPTTRGK
jgi:hypothetical protein